MYNDIKKQMSDKMKSDKEVELTASGKIKTKVNIQTNKPKNFLPKESQDNFNSIIAEDENDPYFIQIKKEYEDSIDNKNKERLKAGDRPFMGKSDISFFAFAIISISIELPMNIDVFQDMELIYGQWVTTFIVGVMLVLCSHYIGVFMKQYKSIKIHNNSNLSSQLALVFMSIIGVFGTLVFLFYARVDHSLILAGVTNGIFSDEALSYINSSSIIKGVVENTWFNFVIVGIGIGLGYKTSDSHYGYKDAVNYEKKLSKKFHEYIINTNEKVKAYTS